MFQAVLHSALSVKETTHDYARTNIKNPQVKQQRDYKCHQSVYSQLNNDDKVFLKDQKRQDRKGEKFT